ncbi:MAG: hypothetical protein ACJAZO_004343 [Myxococcota bacterium]|jgi:hypothetical protein
MAALTHWDEVFVKWIGEAAHPPIYPQDKERIEAPFGAIS